MKVAFIGGGNMAGALIGGMVDGGFEASSIDVLEIDVARGTELAERYRVRTHQRAGDWLRASNVMVLAVKPQQMQAAAAAIKPHLARALVLSIAAGVRTQTIGQWLTTSRIVRAMPNMPALIRAGISAAIALPGVSAGERQHADGILSAVGTVIWLDEESMLDAVTALSGSGPAYVFYFIEAMQAVAREMGFSEAHARALTLQTFTGAAQLASQSDESASALRAKVTSKGGTTAAALESFERDKVAEAIARAIRAAAARAHELGS
ncbi:MAG TPA: pyrroline-5-carboxylate reductase [Burkholderiaceae bacterium]|nr:pyrroline-5-carboxylate reductase [Burkholderiaceae bacterium]